MEAEAMGMERRSGVVTVEAGDWLDAGLGELEKSRVTLRNLDAALDSEEHAATCQWVQRSIL